MLAEQAPRDPHSGSDETPNICELAPAKLNLALHVTGQRADGYHLIETIVTFAEVGDRLHFSPADEDSLTVSGRFCEGLTFDPADNLVTRARDSLRGYLQETGRKAPSVSIHLEKNLPIASGIGGGSADAAATLRGLLRLWKVADVEDEEIDRLALTLGADVPMCLQGRPAIARGVGELLTPLPKLPQLALVLANPLIGVSTPEVFSRLASRSNSPLPPLSDGRWIDILAKLRNDLEEPAIQLVPEIRDISDLLTSHGASLTRMSGSGATCFGIFPAAKLADQAASSLQAIHPDWYFQATRTISGNIP